MSTNIPIELILSRLPDAKRQGSGYKAKCPAHDDKHPSLCFSEGADGSVLIKCQAGCTLEAILHAIGREKRDLFPQNNSSKQRGSNRRIKEIYKYADATGKLIYEVVRYKPKGFSQRRPDGNGGYITNVEGLKKIPYQLPLVTEAIRRGETIYITEGEKDVHTLLKIGLTATCNAGGAGKWEQGFSEYFEDAHVVILPHNDDVGRSHAESVASSLRQSAASIKVFEIPGLSLKGDISDYIENGGTMEELLPLIDRTPEWSPKPEGSQPNLPEIVITKRQQRDVTSEVLEALVAGNDPPQLFTRGGGLVRIRKGVSLNTPPCIEPVSVDVLRSYMSRSANYKRSVGNRDIVDTYPPIDNARDILALDEWPFPPLTAITATPIVREDGSILTRPGYDEKTGLLYIPNDGFELEQLPAVVTIEDIFEAKKTIQDILADFPLVSPADYANVVGMILTPVMRPAISGCIPLCIVNAPQPGAGKGLLTGVVSVLATGRDASMMTAPTTAEEWRKGITSCLISGRTLIHIDNVEHTLSDSNLASVLTSTSWSDRMLGTNKSISIPNRAFFIATGNNVKISGDLPRRCFRITIDPKTSRPELRQDFRHDNLLEYCQLNRGKILTALLTLARYWYDCGCPLPSSPILGSFESWSRTIGGILECCGIPDFLGNTDDSRRNASDEDNDMEGFLGELLAISGGGVFTTKKIDGWLNDNSQLLDALPDQLAEVRDSKEAFARKLGKALSQIEGRCYGENNIHIAKAPLKTGNKQHWMVVTS